MSQDEAERAEGAKAGEADGGGGLAPTPFDGPLAAPLIFLAMAVWFAYDGWWNRSPGAHSWRWLSRGGAGAFVLLAAYFLVRALREWRAGG